jgi:hypothetical protein
MAATEATVDFLPLAVEEEAQPDQVHNQGPVVRVVPVWL